MKYLWWLAVFTLTACAHAEIVPTPVMTPWGSVQVIAYAPTADAPALLITPAQRWLAWTEARTGEVRHMAAHDNDSRILALSAWQPFAYTLLPARTGQAHWLWLDRTANTDSLRLQSALVSADLVAQLGPVLLSQALTTRYSALALDDGQALVAWSEGSGGATTLHLTRLDADGRPPFTESVTLYGAYPTLTRTPDGTVWLYWLDDGVWRARLTDTQLSDVTRLLDEPRLDSTDRLESFTAANDGITHTLLWQIVNAHGEPRTLISSSGDGTTWTMPQPLAFNTGSATFVTSYNGGSAQTASVGETPVGWATPLTGQDGLLPLAVTWNNRLGMLYLRAGRPVGVQDLVGVGTLFSAPQIATDTDRHLTLTWSQPFDAQTARLLLLSTRP